ncbi:LAMI_0H14708g1_1 [Lachancea mirantina]|uniref:LAMI_0H14708g1_1 n=1 Tax=Lachancea mirantina TaxID=1230905 RepID=A0A1G4KIH7_9SACH|nr:LAMI_0H14708g1_1 [Lachancea mirantina]
MKFGLQILDQSVPEWRINNIDYDALKKGIRRVTTQKADRGSGGVGQSLDAMDPLGSTGSIESNAQPAQLAQLKQQFRHQFRGVNLFVSMKIKEISTRLVSVESSILKLQRQTLELDRQSGSNKQRRARQLRLITSHLEHCNADLLKVSRFLILQKIAVRKLLKKFRKHYPYGDDAAQAFISEVTECPELTEGHEGVSFTTVDLDPYLLEISLVMDVLQDMGQDSNYERNSSASASEDNGFSGASRGLSVASNAGSITTALKFDTVFAGLSSRLQALLVSEQSVAELKFALVSLGFHVVDEENISASRQIIDSTGSPDISPRGQVDPKLVKPVKSFQDLQQAMNQKQNTPLQNKKPNLPIALTMLESSEPPGFVRDNAINQFPNMIIHGQKPNRCALNCHVGGLRDHVTTESIPLRLVSNFIYHGHEQHDNELPSNLALAPLDKLCLEWIFTRKKKAIKPLILLKRTRFMKSVGNMTYLISVEEDITLDRTLLLPTCHMEIRTVSTHSSAHPAADEDLVTCSVIKEILDKKLLCYPLDYNSTLWRLAYELRDSQDIKKSFVKYFDDSHTARDVAALFDLGHVLMEDYFQVEKSNRALPSIMNKKKRQSLAPPPDKANIIRYWNEFDDPDENADEDGFYTNNDLELGRGTGGELIVLNKRLVKTAYNVFQHINGFFGCASQEREYLLSKRHAFYSQGSVSSFNTTPEESNDNDLSADYRRIEASLLDTQSVFEYQHDQVLSFLYLSTMLVSCVTSGVACGVLISLFRMLDDTGTQLDNGGALVAVTIISLATSFTLTCTSLLLLFSRFEMAPWWHYISCFLLFFLVTCSVCYGLVELFL